MIFNLNAKTARLYKMIIISGIIFLGSFLTVLSADASNIGIVSLTRVTASHPNTEKISQLNQELRTELQTRQEELNQRGKGLEEAELIKLEEQFNAEWEPVKQKLLAQMQALQAERNSDIIQAIRTVGENGNYQAIINSEVPVHTGSDISEYPVILYGGENVTQEVIAEIQRITAAS